MRVCFVHPDLGIGGAERLVVDAALALKRKGHTVKFVTAHHDNKHCFKETKDELPVTVYGDFLPRHLFGRFHAVFAYLRMIYCALRLVLSDPFKPEVIFCDQISACIPFLRLFAPSGTRIVFYCHFPDQLLTRRTSLAKSLYRKPIDWLEEKTTGMADVVLVNSNFTAGIFRDTFRSLSEMNPGVLYPSLDAAEFEKYQAENHKPSKNEEEFIFLSINRFERKKNLELAIKAFALICQKHRSKFIHLVMAGGYDPRLSENVTYKAELENLAKKLGLVGSVTFLQSPSDAKKQDLLHQCCALLYTPSGEHFGIVPLEGMAAGVPVIAVNDGGPTETVVDGKTGFLRNADEESFAAAMDEVITMGKEGRARMGQNGKDRIKDHFSFSAFANRLDRVIKGQDI